MDGTAILIGTARTCRRVEQQLALLAAPPRVTGWIRAGAEPAGGGAMPAATALGELSNLEALVAAHRPDVALVCLPSVMRDLITSIRTRLRRLRVPDRFIPTLEDLLAGVGPRTELDIDPATLLDRPPRWLDDDAMRAVLAHRRVLITGAGGSIGSELARIAASYEPEALILVDRSENALFEIDRQIGQRAPNVRRVALLHDVVDAQGTLAHVQAQRPHVIFHAAAHKHVPMMEDHPAAAVDNNLFGTKAAADAAHAAGVERFVLISTDKAVNPVSIMGATKRLAELYVQHLDGISPTDFCLVRFGNVLGSTGSVLDIWSRQIADGGPVTVTDPRMTRYFMTIAEAARLVVQAASLVDTHAPGGEVFVLDMGEPVRIVELARRFVAAYGLRPVLPGEAAMAEQGPDGLAIVFTGARPGEKLAEQLARDADDLLPTRHPDINIWMLPPPDRRYIEMVLSRLGRDRRPADARPLARAIHEFVAAAAISAAA